MGTQVRDPLEKYVEVMVLFVIILFPLMNVLILKYMIPEKEYIFLKIFRPTKWFSPLCGTDKRQSANSINTVYPIGPMVYALVCENCAETKKGEIKDREWLFFGSRKGKQDCEHDWMDIYPGRHVCRKCDAALHWECGCIPGTVCQEHYNEFLKVKYENLKKWIHESWRNAE